MEARQWPRKDMALKLEVSVKTRRNLKEMS